MMLDNRLTLELMIKERQRSLIELADERRQLKELDQVKTEAGAGKLNQLLRKLAHQVRMLI